MCTAPLVACPVGGSWGPWGPWSSCSRSCRTAGAPDPERIRSRSCDSPPPSEEPPGAPCGGNGSERQSCPGVVPCPVDGSWGSWAPASPCPVTCGLGAVTWVRACDSPAPQHGGRGCYGNGTRRELCGPHGPCPDVPRWSPWGAWSPCVRPLWGQLSCQEAVGQQRRTRECVGRRPGGPPCPTDEDGGTIQVHACYNIQHCLLEGNWSDWSSWSLCTPPCGASPTRSRTRECQPVYPDYPLWVTPVGSSTPSRVRFWGSPRPRCPPLDGQRLRLEEKQPCEGGRGCPAPHED
ncbi:properdin [Cuculus canorus]|uniref:properdin n=1 Tax=Cuculus canorus TaxID=55661 RepID=UPI0023AB458E|nr:properdin [Cuculus canorus]